MKYVLNADQMKASDSRMIQQIGIPSLVLMERAAQQCVEMIKQEMPDAHTALVVCGSGNNGGDGFAVARILYEEGVFVEAAFVGKLESRSYETETQMKILQKIGVPIVTELPDKEYDVIIDAVFGIGLCRRIEGRYANVIERMNQYQGYKVAVDIASGISADTGAILGCAFRADLTVTFAYAKAGQLYHPGADYTGKLTVRPIGIWNPELEQSSDVYYHFEQSDLKAYMPKRRPDSNKGTYGKVLVIAGSKGMSGAAYLAAKAAYVTGAGLVRIYTDESNRQILQQLLPEAVLTTYQSEAEEAFGELQSLLDWADVVCMGSGIGRSQISEKLVKLVWKQNEKPCVLDADGLNIWSGFTEEERMEKKAVYIFTPHMKEMERISGNSVAQIKENRKEILKNFVEKYDVYTALKDSRTLVTGANKQIYMNISGNAAMAKAGAGDVLAGVITGIMAQGTAPYEAAALGVYLHGLGGDTARESKGAYSVLAQDIIEGISDVLRRIEEL